MKSVQAKLDIWQRLQAALDAHERADAGELTEAQRDEITRLEKEAEAALHALHAALVAYRTRSSKS
jgi:hypothetical protein